MQNAGLDKSQAGIRNARRNINNLRCADDNHSNKEESEKAGLKLNIQKQRSWHEVSPVHGRQMGEKWKQWQILFSWAPTSPWMVNAAMKLKDVCSLEGKLW